MDDDQNTGKESLKSKRYFLFRFNVVLFVLISAIIIFSLWFFWYRAKTDEPITQEPQITGLEIALKSATFLDKLIRPDGTVLGAVICNERTEKCPPEGYKENYLNIIPSPFPFDQVINAYLLLEETTGNKSYREKAEQAINYILDRCNDETDFCKLNFSSIAQYYDKTGDQKYFSAMLSLADNFLSESDEAIVFEGTGQNLALLFNATGDARYKNRLLKVADAELNRPLYQTENADYIIRAVWYLYLPAHQVSKEAKYLTVAETIVNDLLKQGRVSEIFEDQINAIITADSLLALADLRGNGEYRTQAHNILQDLLDSVWDTPENIKYRGDYGFIYTLTRDRTLTAAEIQQKPGLFNYWKVFNGRIVKLFTLMKDDNFDL
ncbi:MAG: hypothetical protein A3B86_03890 [Candidatus Yanofskybacteria bacterium RIFCSPHIGHO2_02_FULL_38_22b]|uniref:Squalene cyclase C-terminal domain-containing protein n=1 Tax=Candidatus Yanofskybacteria bacterium RIFCSPHIGHO2_02_FULL_38_22b TaxID=1802673 RepID=A0A1F8EZD6_9BACT|nr:MAG: hypothetical protein A2816_01660 [Candidatus Yanofskybacteria bacterium RIFCSPHIGHO2_01_FULL_39_44]OGN06232.1 MAG: hypothetical protein A3B86_03890 [Candidatus Yanofskybacteria bacterium RIFCSPHIGHO2_02_FULL_38_22b]OGN19652.1 MAG: hypothetical protein A2910_03625 [Candidatus Yanofskybacteria bacterium RIFCSPLOWO2_01_FULL_39_28]